MKKTNKPQIEVLEQELQYESVGYTIDLKMGDNYITVSYSREYSENSGYNVECDIISSDEDLTSEEEEQVREFIGGLRL